MSSREKPFKRRSREQSRAYSELSYEWASKIIFKRLCANYQFRIVLFSIESFDSWLCLLGKEAKQSVEQRSREPAEHIQSYLLNSDRQSCYHYNESARTLFQTTYFEFKFWLVTVFPWITKNLRIYHVNKKLHACTLTANFGECYACRLQYAQYNHR